MATREIFLHEELMLLALRDRNGTIAAGTNYTFAVGGAVVAELLLSERIGLDRDGKKVMVEVLDATAFRDSVLDEWLEKMAESKKRRTPQDWVTRIASTKDLKHRVARRLSQRGILRTDEDKVLWIFTRKIYPELDPGPERRLMDRLETAIFGDGDVDPRTAVLLSVAHHGGVLRAVFDKGRLKTRDARIKQISEGAVSAKATKEAIEAMQAAVLVAVFIPTVVSST